MKKLKSIPSFPEYLIDNKGTKVFSTKTSKYLSVHFHSGIGYWVVRLGDKLALVHRLVAETYLPNPNNLPVVRHLNNDVNNNSFKNLAWGTSSENNIQRYRDERFCRFTKADILEIHKLYYQEGLSCKQISLKYGVSRRSINYIVKGEHYNISKTYNI